MDFYTAVPNSSWSPGFSVSAFPVVGFGPLAVGGPKGGLRMSCSEVHATVGGVTGDLARELMGLQYGKAISKSRMSSTLDDPDSFDAGCCCRRWSLAVKVQRR